MTTAAIRDKLYDYIKLADEKKLKAIYMMLEDDIEEKLEWWKDKSFVQELDAEYKEWQSCKAKGHTLDEINASIDKLRAKRNNK